MKDGVRRVDQGRVGAKVKGDGVSTSSKRGGTSDSPMRFNLERLNNAELFKMVSIDHSTYSEESIRCAREILEARGEESAPHAFSAEERERHVEEWGETHNHPEGPGRTTFMRFVKLIAVALLVSLLGGLIQGVFR